MWVYDMMNTIVHELAHVKYDWHGEQHNGEMMRIAHWLIQEGLYSKLEGQFRAIFNAHYEELVEASKEFYNSNNI